jgi:hypothetical protein
MFVEADLNVGLYDGYRDMPDSTSRPLRSSRTFMM